MTTAFVPKFVFALLHKLTYNALMRKNPPCQIYLLTPPHIGNLSHFAKTFESVLQAAPIGCLQIRLKDTPKSQIVETAKALIPIARQYETNVLINDDPHIALETGADGVHLGQTDMSITNAQELLPKGSIIGITCHNSRDLAFKAGSGGASYIAFGSFFDTPTKPSASRADLEILTWWRHAAIIPSVAIGGITTRNADQIIKAGADFIALCSGLWESELGPANAAAHLHQLCLSHSLD